MASVFSSFSVSAIVLLDLQQVADAVDHASRLRRVLDLDRLADPAQAQRAQRLALGVVCAVLGLGLRDLHQELSSDGAPSPSGTSAMASEVVSGGAGDGSSGPVASAAASTASSRGSSASALIVSDACSRPDRPSTSSIDRPRSSATSSGRRRLCRPATVALTRLIGFWEPSDLLRMSWIPASSSTARTPPPAITPVPGEAGLSITRPEPKMPVVWWVIVEPCLGTLKRFFLARSTPFWIASGTSLALP